jgi:hypothetical protein
VILKQQVVLLAVLAAGVFAGWQLKPAPELNSGQRAGIIASSKLDAIPHSTAIIGGSRKITPVGKVESTASRQSLVNAVKVRSTDIIAIPLGLIDVGMPPLLSSGDLEGLGSVLISYRLPPERIKLLNEGIRGIFKKLQDIEAASSRLVTSPNGDQFVHVDAFQEEGEQLRGKLKDLLDAGFEGIEDDRRLVFDRQIASSKLFSDFGATPKEISIDQLPNSEGTQSFALSVRPPSTAATNTERIRGGSSVPLDPAYVKNRYGHLFPQTGK